MECLVCKGTGQLPEPNKKTAELKREAALILLEKGFGIREVQRLLGYKSPRSVQDFLNKNKLCEICNAQHDPVIHFQVSSPELLKE